MADTGVKYPATVSATQETGDDNDWVNPANVGADDAAYASITAATFDGPNDVSYLLKATNFSMGVPADATIVGIIVAIERYCDSGETCKDVDVCLTKDGSARVGDDKSEGAIFNVATVTIVSFGGATDLWNTTWTPAEINATTFGVLYKMGAVDANADGYVDFIRVTVYYTAPTTTPLAVAGTMGAVSGTLVRVTSKQLSGTSGALSGTLTKQTSKSLSGIAGSLSGVLANAKMNLLSVAGTVGSLVGAITNSATYALALSGIAGVLSGVVAKMTGKSFSGTTGALTGSIGKAIGKSLSGQLSPTGTLSETMTFGVAISGIVGSLTGAVSNVYEAGTTAFKLAVDGVLTMVGSLNIWRHSSAPRKFPWHFLRKY